MIEELFIRSSSDAPALRIGMMLDNFFPVPPASDILSQIRRCNFLELVLIVRNTVVGTTSADRSESGLDSPQAPVAAERSVGILFDWYQRWDRGRIGSESSVLEQQDCTALVAGAPVVKWPGNAAESDACTREAMRLIEAARLDVLIHLASARPSRSMLTMARYGVWTIRFGEERRAGSPPYFWEMVDHQPLTEVTLRILTEHPDEYLVLAQAQTRTESFASLARNSFAPVSIAKTLVIQKLHQVHELGWPHVQRKIRTVNGGRKQNERRASNGQMLRFLGPQLIRQGRRRVALSNTIEHWRVARRPMRTAPDVSVYGDAAGYEGIDAPPGRYYADPFLWSNNGARYLFVEDFSYAADKGSISCLEIAKDGSLGDPVTVIERPYHCSYPQIVNGRDGQIFMVPETGFNSTVEVYSAVDFPHKWRLERTLFHGPAFDPTVLEHDGLFWFFVTLIDRVEHYCPQLFLFYSDSLMGEWTLHPESPISRDVRTARCGGSIFCTGDKLIRVAQDGSPSYGYGLRFMEIVTLNTREYVEREVRSLDCTAFAGSIGVHTYNRSADLEVIDIKRRVSRRAANGHAP